MGDVGIRIDVKDDVRIDENGDQKKDREERVDHKEPDGDGDHENADDPDHGNVEQNVLPFDDLFEGDLPLSEEDPRAREADDPHKDEADGKNEQGIITDRVDEQRTSDDDDRLCNGNNGMRDDRPLEAPFCRAAAHGVSRRIKPEDDPEGHEGDRDGKGGGQLPDISVDDPIELILEVAASRTERAEEPAHRSADPVAVKNLAQHAEEAVASVETADGK